MVYEAAMPLATQQILTEVQASPEGDVRYPSFDEGDWAETAREEHLGDQTPWLVRWLQRR